MKLSLSALLGWKKILLSFTGVLGIMLVLYLGYRHYVSMVREIGDLRQTVGVLNTALDSEQAAVRDLLQAIEDWRAAQGGAATLIEGMENDSREATEETRWLQRLFTELDWSNVSPDSVANAVTDRMWKRIIAASDSGLYRGATPSSNADSTTTPRGASVR